MTSAQTAVSPAVDSILQRADEGIAEANNGDFVATFVRAASPEWAAFIAGSVYSSIDTAPRDASGRGGETICFRTDLFLLETKLEDVRQEMHAAFARSDAMALLKLDRVYRYVQDRYALLRQGGADPTVVDTTWRRIDPADQTPSENICYFHTDYLPPTLEGYGCDAEAMNAALSRLPTEHEVMRQVLTEHIQAWTQVQTAADEYRERASALGELEREIDIAIGRTPTDATDAQTPYVRPDPLHGCVRNLPTGVALRSRGSTLFPSGEIAGVRAFRDARVNQESVRPLPGRLPAGEGDLWTNALRAEGERESRNFTQRQAARESATFVMGVDSMRMTEDALQDLHASVGSLATVAITMDGGLRGFVRDFAFYLLRSCMERPCTQTLNRVLSLTFADECFPYTNGEYLKDTVENPRWRKCEEAAGL